MAINWGQMYSQGSSYVPQEPKLAKPKWNFPKRKGGRARKKKWTYTTKKGDTVWSVAEKFQTTPEELLGLNKVNQLRPGIPLNIYKNETPLNNRFNQAQAKVAKDRRDKRWYNPQGVGGIRTDYYSPGNLPYQDYRLNWFAEQGVLPLTVNEWVADQLGYTELLKEYGYRLNSELNRWERPADIQMTGTGSGSGGGYGYGGSGGYGGGGGRGGGGSQEPYPQDAGMGFGGPYASGGYGASAPRMVYTPRGTSQTGRKWGGAGLINWRI
jgi:hypothetical protein